MRDRPWDRDEGSVAPEQIAVIVLVASVIAAIWAIALPERTEEVGEQAVDCLFSGDAACLDIAAAPERSTHGGEPRTTVTGEPLRPPGWTPPSPPPSEPEDPPAPRFPERPTVDECSEGPAAERDDCLTDARNPWTYEEVYFFDVGGCEVGVEYRQKGTSIETVADFAPGPVPAGYSVSPGLARSSPDGCSYEVRVFVGTDGLDPITVEGWTEPAAGHIGSGVLHEMEFTVTEPDGTRTVVRVRPGDGHDVGPTSGWDGEPEIHRP